LTYPDRLSNNGIEKTVGLRLEKLMSA